MRAGGGLICAFQLVKDPMFFAKVKDLMLLNALATLFEGQNVHRIGLGPVFSLDNELFAHKNASDAEILQ